MHLCHQSANDGRINGAFLFLKVLELFTHRLQCCVAFFFGFEAVPTPFKGGLLLPSPLLQLPTLVTDAGGGFALDTVMPAGGVPAGVDVIAQLWLQDGSVFPAVTSTNGVKRTTP